MAGCIPFEANTDCCSDAWGSLEDDVKERAQHLAWSALGTLTAGRVGRCPVTIRPCLENSTPCSTCYSGGQWMTPYVDGDGFWRNNMHDRCKCSCERICEIVLPGPAAQIDAIEIDGIGMDLSLVRLDNFTNVVRQDGLCWPACQNMNAPLGDPYTLGITYVPGIHPGPDGLWAAGVLACEFAKACTGEKCRLPSNVTSVVRSGVSITFSSDYFENGTGIREVDAYVFSVNPHGLRTQPHVWSPDLPNHRTTTWTGSDA